MSKSGHSSYYQYAAVLSWGSWAAVLIGSLFDKNALAWALSRVSYYLIFGLFLGWALALYQRFQEEGQGPPARRVLWKTHCRGVFVALLLTVAVFATVPKYLRVLSDEANLLSVARSMTFERRIDCVTEGERYYNMFWPLQRVIDKRPFLFPFFVQLFHVLTGYRVENVFILNFFVLWAVLASVYFISRPWLSEAGASAVMVAVVGQPMVSLCATSGGFELFNLLFILLSFLGLREFLQKPSAGNFSLLLLNLLMLANVRYESVLFLVVTLTVLAARRCLRREHWQRSRVLLLAPWTLLPLIWQRALMSSSPDRDLPGGSWLAAFGWENFFTNLTILPRYLFDPGGSLGYGGVFNILWFGAMGFLLVQGLRDRRDPRKLGPSGERTWTLTVTACLLALAAVVLSYQGGINDHPLNGRLYLPFFVAAAVAGIVVLSRWFLTRQAWILGACLAGFVLYHPVAMQDRLTNWLLLVREQRFLTDYFQKLGDPNILVIYERAQQLIIYNYGAISSSTAAEKLEDIRQQYAQGLIGKIFAVQSVAYRTKEVLPGQALPGAYRLTPVAQLQNSPTQYIRISQVSFE